MTIPIIPTSPSPSTSTRCPTSDRAAPERASSTEPATAFERVALATDLTSPIPADVASALGTDVGALELITVSASKALASFDRADLDRLAAQRGWPPAACTVLVADDVVTAILRHVERRRRTLLVIGSSGPAPWTSPSARSISRAIINTADRPVLLVGPNVDVDDRPRPGKLVLAVDDPRPDQATIDAVTSWTRTFDSGLWLVHAGDAIDERTMFSSWTDALSGLDRHVAHVLVPGDNAARSLLSFTTGVRNAVLVATSHRYTDGHRHVSSTTRHLIRRATHPVLVVPATRSAEGAATESLPVTVPLDAARC